MLYSTNPTISRVAVSDKHGLILSTSLGVNCELHPHPSKNSDGNILPLLKHLPNLRPNLILRELDILFNALHPQQTQIPILIDMHSIVLSLPNNRNFHFVTR